MNGETHIGKDWGQHEEGRAKIARKISPLFIKDIIYQKGEKMAKLKAFVLFVVAVLSFPSLWQQYMFTLWVVYDVFFKFF